jgi:hypothetical protein
MDKKYLPKGEFYKGKIKLDITGQEFGKLKVLKYYGHHKRQQHCCWECLCVCGNKKVIAHSSLVRGRSKSCGCSYTHGNNHKCWRGHGEISGKIFSHIKSHAIKRDQEFNITIEHIWNLFLHQDRKCALSGLPIRFSLSDKEHRKRLTTASLDRIDSNKGYIEGNVQWVHKDINWMKNDFDNQYFIEICKKVAQKNKENW